MFLLFRIILILSITGTATALLLIILKPVTSKHFSAKWQYYIWIVVLITLVFPVPIKSQKSQAKIPPPPFLMPAVYDGVSEISGDVEDVVYQDENTHKNPAWRTLVSYAWLLGMCIYLLSALVSYWHFLAKKKSISRKANIDISSIAQHVGVKKIPPVRISADQSPPMLVGVIRPVIYLPDRNIEECLNLVLMHELMHYKRHDLLYKWAALVINGIHWFNPAVYIVTANINEACEISCDIEVTKNMDESEKKKYMQTILNMIHS